MGWDNEKGKHSGLVCADCDERLGRLNLIDAGLSENTAIQFEHYLAETVDLMMYPDFPEWCKQRGYPDAVHLGALTHTTPVGITRPSSTVDSIALSHRTHNALRRYNITTIEELANTSDDELLKIRNLGVKCLNEIHERLKELGYKREPPPDSEETHPNKLHRNPTPKRIP